jgi:hypothetical protein
MEVGRGPNWVCSAIRKKIICFNDSLLSIQNLSFRIINAFSLFDPHFRMMYNFVFLPHPFRHFSACL